MSSGGGVQRDYSSPGLNSRRLMAKRDKVAAARAKKERREAKRKAQKAVPVPIFKKTQPAGSKWRNTYAPSDEDEDEEDSSTGASSTDDSDVEDHKDAGTSQDPRSTFKRQPSKQQLENDRRDVELERLMKRQEKLEEQLKDTSRELMRRKTRDDIRAAQEESPAAQVRQALHYKRAQDLRRHLAELLDRAKLCVPYIRAVNQHVEEARDLMLKAVDQLEDGVRRHERRQSLQKKPQELNREMQDAAVADAGDDFGGPPVRVPEQYRAPAVAMQLRGMATTVTEDYQSPSLKNRSLRSRNRAREPAEGVATVSGGVVAALSRVGDASWTQSRAVLGDDDDLEERMAAARRRAQQAHGAQSSPQMIARAGMAQDALARGAVQDQGMASQTGDKPAFLQKLKHVGPSVTYDYMSPRTQKRRLRKDKKEKKKKQKRRENSREEGRLEELHVHDREAGEDERIRPRAMTQTRERPLPPGSPKEMHSLMQLQDLAITDMEKAAKRLEQQQERNKRTPKPSYLRKIQFSQAKKPRSKTSEQRQLEDLIQRAEASLALVQHMDLDQVESSAQFLSAAVQKLEAYSAMMR